MSKTTQDQLDKLANLYNKTKDPKHKDQWNKLVEERYGTTSALHYTIVVKPGRFDSKRSIRVYKRNDTV